MIKTESTLDTLRNLSNALDYNDKVYFVRFGDGEFGIAANKHGSKFQPYNEKLSCELKEAFLIKDKCYIIALMAGYDNEQGMTQGVFAQTMADNNKWLQWLSEDIQLPPGRYANHATLAWLAIHNTNLINDFLNRYIRNKTLMFVGQISQQNIQLLLGDIQYYVNTPFRDAYSSIDKIFNEILLNIDNIDVLVTACGPLSKVIAKRLWLLDKKIHLIDLGSLAGIYDTVATHSWHKSVTNDYKNLLKTE